MQRNVLCRKNVYVNSVSEQQGQQQQQRSSSRNSDNGNRRRTYQKKKKREIERKCKYWQHRAEQRNKKSVCKLPGWLVASRTKRNLYADVQTFCTLFAPTVPAESSSHQQQQSVNGDVDAVWAGQLRGVARRAAAPAPACAFIFRFVRRAA